MAGLARCLAKWAICNVLNCIGLLRLLEQRRARTVRIFGFHRFSATRIDDGMTVSRAIFDAELGYLTKQHHVVSLDEAATMLQGQCPLVRGAIAITFDDGYRDNFTLALP